MNTTIAIILAQSLNLAAFIFLAFWYAVPWLKSSSRVNALTALILVHLGRTPGAPTVLFSASGNGRSRWLP